MTNLTLRQSRPRIRPVAARRLRRDRRRARRGRIFRQTDGQWFWGVSFQLTGRKSYGHAPTLDEAKAAFRAEYGAWQSRAG
jgi:hypothetical protein